MGQLLYVFLVHFFHLKKSPPKGRAPRFSLPGSPENSDPEAAQLVARVRAGSVLHELQRDLKELEVQILGWAQFFGGALGFSKTDGGGDELYTPAEI